jgi:hypothetical protein
MLVRQCPPPPLPQLNQLVDFHEAWFPFHLRNFWFPKANIKKLQLCEPEDENNNQCGALRFGLVTDLPEFS